MRKTIAAERLRPAIALVMSFLLSPLCPPASSSDSFDRQAAGKITGVSASASADGLAAAPKTLVRTNELLSTNKSGRLRVELDDGSLLSIGSQTQLTIAKHSSATGETLLKVTSGRVRSRVAKARKGARSFAITTPQARISVVGTDFFLDVTPERTQVVVYEGIVLVGAAEGGSPVDVAAGQMTSVDRHGISRLVLTPEDYEQQTIAETSLLGEVVASTAPEQQRPERKPSHLKRNLLIGVAVAGGALAAGLAARGTSSSSSQTATPQPSVPSIPPH